MTPTERALIAKYEAVLEREGLGRIENNRMGFGWSDRTTKHRSRATDGAVAAFWRAVSSGVGALPVNYPLRGFLFTLSETGNLLGSCRAHGITHMKGRWAFRAFLRGIGLGHSRPARYW